MTEVSIGSPISPLSDTASGSPQAGKRMRPLDGEAPYGAGDTPRFTVRAPGNPAPALRTELVDPTVQPATPGAGIELVRPDGYLAMSAQDRDWASVERYLERLATGSQLRTRDAALRQTIRSNP